MNLHVVHQEEYFFGGYKVSRISTSVTFTFDAVVVEALALSDLPSPYLKH
jgi:hypothetical protein